MSDEQKYKIGDNYAAIPIPPITIPDRLGMVNIQLGSGPLEQKRKILIEYMQMKISESDWHGVCDAGMDLRELEVEIRHAKSSGKD